MHPPYPGARIYSNILTGKTSFFVANQANIPTLPAEEIAALKEELGAVEDENKLLAAEVKAAAAGNPAFHGIILLILSLFPQN